MNCSEPYPVWKKNFSNSSEFISSWAVENLSPFCCRKVPRKNLIKNKKNLAPATEIRSIYKPRVIHEVFQFPQHFFVLGLKRKRIGENLVSWEYGAAADVLGNSARVSEFVGAQARVRRMFHGDVAIAIPRSVLLGRARVVTTFFEQCDGRLSVSQRV